MKQFENPSGIDTVISTLFETQFVWADTDPSDISDFSTTKICGQLLKEAAGGFFEGEQWKRFVNIHGETFNGDGDSLCKRTKSIENEIETILHEQYGKANIRFNFPIPDTSTFFKAGDITVNDGVETPLDDKGTGLQRAIALAMIQVYANALAKHESDAKKSKPIFFFIDEPEICLHPKAQKQLLKALIKLSDFRQIFICTHSPYLLRDFKAKIHGLFIFKRITTDNVGITRSPELNLFAWSPSWGEINYHAYGLPTIEFHDELYGTLQTKYISDTADNRIDNFDKNFLANKDVSKQTKLWSRLKHGQQEPASPVTLSTYIRNKVHHPESMGNSEFTGQELADSIDFLISHLKN